MLRVCSTTVRKQQNIGRAPGVSAWCPRERARLSLSWLSCGLPDCGEGEREAVSDIVDCRVYVAYCWFFRSPL